MIRQSKRSPFLSAAGLVLSLCAASTAFAGQANTSGLRDGRTYERFIVRFDKAAPEQRDPAALRRTLAAAGQANGVGVTHLRKLAVGSDVLRTDRKLDRARAAALIRRLANAPGVAYVEVDALREALGVPNDPGYGGQWNLNEALGGINYAAATDLATGAGTVVAVIDTGITVHSELAPQVLYGYDFISDANISRDGSGRDNDPGDVGDSAIAGQCYLNAPATNSSWHGTHVAGTIAALANNGKGMAGVAPAAKILPVRVLGRCGGYDSDIADAILWAAGLSVPGLYDNAYPADVINLSLGGPGTCAANSSMQLAIDAAVAAGTTVVVAAGNNNANASGFSPANCAGVVAVGATGRTGARASYSNYGPIVDLSAPGGDGYEYIWSTSNTGLGTTYTESFGGKMGTSMAAPHVAGTVALMQSARTNTPALVETLLKRTARPLPVACSPGCGAGIVDAAAAVKAASTQPTLSVNDVSVTEGNVGSNKTAVFTVSLSWPTNVDVTYKASTGSGGTATPGTDFTALASTQFTIPAGSTSATHSIAITGDATPESNEVFGLNLATPVNATIADAGGHATIVNDEQAMLSINDITIAEGNSGTKPATFTISLSQVATAPVIFTVATYEDGTAKSTTGDFVASTLANQTIPAGQLAKTFSVVLNGDTVAEADETLVVKVTAVTGAGVTDNTGVATITNDEPRLWVEDVSLAEGSPTSGGTAVSTSIPVHLRLSNAAAGPITCTAQAANGTATSPVDHAATFNTINFAIGDTEKVFSVYFNKDLTVENDETFVVNVACSALSNATLVDNQAVVTLLDDDRLPQLTISNPGVTEGANGTKAMTFGFTLSAASDVPVTFNVATRNGTATAGSDYTALAQAISFAPGETYRTVAVTIAGDTAVEANENINLDLTNLVGATAISNLAIGEITNDDGPTLSIADASITEGDSGTKLLTFTVTLSQAMATNVSYSINATDDYDATPYVDYRPLGGSGTITPGLLSKTHNITIYGDTAIEQNERFAVRINSPVGATLADDLAIGTLTNDDGPVLSVDDAQVVEGDSGTTTLDFTVHLSAPATRPVSFLASTGTNTATTWGDQAGIDFVNRYQALQVIPAGDTTLTLSVIVNGDAWYEGNETMVLGIGNVDGGLPGDTQATGTIVDDDLPVVYVNNKTFYESDGDYSIPLFAQLSNYSTKPVQVQLRTESGTAGQGGDYTDIVSSPWVTIYPGFLESGNVASHVTIKGDNWSENNEYFYVRAIAVGPEAVLGSYPVGTYYIMNDD